MLLTGGEGDALELATVRRQRMDTGTIPGGATVDIPVAWVVPFTDTNYTVSVTVEELSVGVSALRLRVVLKRSADGMVVRVENTDPLAAKSGLIHVTAYPDW